MSKRSALADARIVLALGTERVLTHRVVDSVLHAARGAGTEATRTDVAADAEDGAGALAIALSPSLFGDTAVVVVSQVEDATDASQAVLLSAISDMPEHVRLVLIHNGSSRGKKMLDAARKQGALEAKCSVTRKELPTMVAAEFRNYQRTATAAAIEALVTAVGDELADLIAAVAQLCADVDDEPINDKTVAGYYTGVADVKSWDVSDPMWKGQPLEMLEKLRWALNEDDNQLSPLVGAIASGLRGLVAYATASTTVPQRDLAEHLGVPGWKLSLLEKQKRMWTPEQLARAVQLLAIADRATKGTRYQSGMPGGEGMEKKQLQYEVERALLAMRPATR